MRDLYRRFWMVLKVLLPMMFLCGILQVGMGFLSNRISSSIWQLIVQLAFAYGAHRYALIGEVSPMFSRPAANAAHPQHTGKFIFVSFLFALSLLVPVLAVFLGFRDAFPDRRGLELLAMPVLGLFYLTVLSVFGTALPAAAIGDAVGEAFKATRIRATFWPICQGLLAGPFVLYLAGLVVIVVIALAVKPVLPLPTIFSVPVDLIFSLWSLSITLFAVVVLCRAYRIVTPAAPDGMTGQDIQTPA